MSERWAARLGSGGCGGLAALRRLPGIEVCESSGLVWLRGADADEALWRLLLGLPGAELFRLLDDGQLVPHQRRVPEGRLPGGTWQALARWLSVTLAPAALPGQLETRVPWRMVASTRERPSQVLLTALESWRAFAVEAAAIRLQPLRFAMDGRGTVIVHGSPLPPVAGVHYCEAEGVAVQAGWEVSPALEARVLARLLGLASGDLALLHADGSWDHVRAGDFVVATRSAVRRSAEEELP